MVKKTTIKGHLVSYDETASGGVHYLSVDLDMQEAKVFFNEARDHGSVVFEDHMGHKYKLIHHSTEYQLVRM